MRFGFRVDASVQMGSGHIMRCLTLADQLKKNGADVQFFCRNFQDQMNAIVKERGYKLNLLVVPSEKYEETKDEFPYAKWLEVTWQKDVEDTINAMGREVCDWMIIDHYGIDYRWHKRMRDCVEKIMVIDDLADRQLDCDLLLDQTYGREVDSYHSLVPDQCDLKLGSHYALLRPEFAKLRLMALEKRLSFKGVQRVLIFMGGSDPDNITGKILGGLTKVNWKHSVIIDVVLGLHAPHIQSLKEQAVNLPLNINVLTNVDNMAAVIFDADLAIGAGGASCWERCSLALPSLIAILADNQRANACNLERLDAAIVWNDIEQLKVSIETVINSNDKWFEMQGAAANICDGLGCSRIVNELVTHDFR